eukprot:GHVU01104544.1.p1 GENE.GHVU01104544.1~~GHVU01104544.1.p1  ORF type:complete len:292 (+),score=56.35 GHVU01104544.1:49-876(+)
MREVQERSEQQERAQQELQRKCQEEQERYSKWETTLATRGESLHKKELRMKEEMDELRNTAIRWKDEQEAIVIRQLEELRREKEKVAAEAARQREAVSSQAWEAQQEFRRSREEAQRDLTRKQVEEQQATLERRSHQLGQDRQKVVQEVAAKEAEIHARETSTAAEKARVARELKEGRHQATLAEHRLAEEQLKLNNEKESLAVSKAHLLERQKEMPWRSEPDRPLIHRLPIDLILTLPPGNPTTRRIPLNRRLRAHTPCLLPLRPSGLAHLPAL